MVSLERPKGSTDDWFTPMDLFEGWDPRSYTVDAAGHAEAPVSQAIGRWWDIEADGLAQDWRGERVWCNPPYSGIAPWVMKAHVSMVLESGCVGVDMLIPANRTEQPFWATYIEPYRDRPPVRGVRLSAAFLPRRRKFGFPGDTSGRSGTSPQFGLVLLRWAREP